MINFWVSDHCWELNFASTRLVIQELTFSYFQGLKPIYQGRLPGVISTLHFTPVFIDVFVEFLVLWRVWWIWLYGHADSLSLIYQYLPESSWVIGEAFRLVEVHSSALKVKVKMLDSGTTFQDFDWSIKTVMPGLRGWKDLRLHSVTHWTTMLRVALEINYRFLGQIRTVIETFAFHCGFGSYSQGRIKVFGFDS